MAASKKPNPAPSKKSATSKRAAPTKAPAKKAAPAAKRAAAPAAKKATAPARKSAASSTSTTTKARATKASTTSMNKSADTTPSPTKTTATKATAKKAAPPAPAKKAVATKAAGTSTTSTAKAAPRRTPKPPSPDTPSILSNYRPDRHEIPAARGTSKDGITYTKDFDVKFLKTQRDELLARRASELARATRLEDEATSLIEDGEMGDVQFDDEGGEGDTMVVQRDLDRVLSTQARQTISDIDAALERIEAGTYGYSEVSGLPIPRERLEALPETTVLAAEKVSGIGLR